MADERFTSTGGGSREDRVPGAGRGDERGERGTYDPDSGEVHGSGSGAGGGGNLGEDYDKDAQAGARVPPAGAPRDIDHADRRPVDPDEGV